MGAGDDLASDLMASAMSKIFGSGSEAKSKMAEAREALDKLRNRKKRESEEVVIRRERRDAYADPKAQLDAQIYHLLSELPGKIDTAVAEIERDIRWSNYKSWSQGWSIIWASWLDIASDYAANNRSLRAFGGTVENDDGTLSVVTNDLSQTVFDYGFLGFYGVGFGAPLILGLPDENLSCGSYDFQNLVDSYGLSHGVSGYFPSYDSSLPAQLSSRVSEFELLSSARLDCVLAKEGDSESAAEVVWALEELIAAINLRLECEESHSGGYGRSGVAAEEAAE